MELDGFLLNWNSAQLSYPKHICQPKDIWRNQDELLKIVPLHYIRCNISKDNINPHI